MPPWIIVLSSAIGAVIAGLALALPEIVNAAPSELGSILMAHLPRLAVAALAVYGLCALLMVSATLLAGILRLRREVEADSPDAALGRRDWVAALGASGFRHLGSRLVSALTQPERVDAGIALYTRFTPNETRSEISRVHYISLARSHFFTALIVLIGVAGLGLAQDNRSIPFPGGAVPTISAILVLFGLVLLTVLSRIAIDVTTEPLLETIAQMPAERVEFGVLRRAAELLDRVSDAAGARDRAAVPPAQVPERLVASIEQGYHALLDAVGRLSTHTEALGAAMRSSVETIEATVRAAAVQQQPVDGNKAAANATAFPELQAAVEDLTAVLERLSAAPQGADEAAPTDPTPALRRAPPPRLARELRRLLQEIDAGG